MPATMPCSDTSSGSASIPPLTASATTSARSRMARPLIPRSAGARPLSDRTSASMPTEATIFMWPGSSGSISLTIATSSPSSSQPPSATASSTSRTGLRSTIARCSLDRRSSSSWRSRQRAASRREFSAAWRSDSALRLRSFAIR